MKIVMTFGTFDKLHQGHLSYLRQAGKQGDYLIVVVGRDKTVFKIKGRLPSQNEKQRLQKVKENKMVDKAVLGQLRDRFAVIKKYKPDIICLGYDQVVNLDKLREIFRGKIVRVKPHREKIYKSSLINSKLQAPNYK